MKRSGVVLFPVPAVGHLVSMIELAKQLRRHGSHDQLSIFLLLIDQFGLNGDHDAAIHKHIKEASKSGLVMEVITLPPPILDADHHPKEEGITRWLVSVERQKTRVKEALVTISAKTAVSAFILDMFCITMTDVAAEVDIPAYVFYTTGAAGVAYKLYCPTLDRKYEQDFEDLKEMITIPGWSSPLPPHSLPDAILRKKDRSYQLLMAGSRLYPQLKGILANTFAELEPIAMKALDDGLCVPDGPSPPVHPVGPLLGLESGRIDSTPEHECVRWLDRQPASSVVFLCFGSLGAFSVEQIREMAHGIELSGHRFLWSVRVKTDPNAQNLGLKSGDLDLNAVLPDGFIERTKHRGLIWPNWVPQIAILSHPAVGGFASHCGWNSTLESVWFGVPTIAWPLYAEQRMNAELLVNDLGLSVGLRESPQKVHARNSLVTAEELESAIRRLMGEGEDGIKARDKVGQMRDLARKAMQEGGSSYSTLAGLVAEWRKNGEDDAGLGDPVGHDDLAQESHR